MCGTGDPSLGPAGKLVDFFSLSPADKKVLFSFSQGVEREHTWGWGAIAAPATVTVSDAQKKKTTQRLRFERPSPVTPTAL